jgi:hypothetical protein
LTRSTTPDDDAYGFAQGGVTAVVFVTTEADCSYGPEAEAIFSPEGSKVFWSLPDEQTLPTSAVCWNAGVQCTGLMDGVYDTCGSVNLDPVSGEPIAAASAALRPLGRYLDQIGGDVKLYGIVGVPPGYPQTPLEYRTAPSGTPNDRDYEVNFGIGPGCVSSTAEAVPPVRLREVIEASASTFPLQSVCQDSYGEALRGIALDIIADF